jgi:hypothetical protein
MGKLSQTLFAIGGICVFLSIGYSLTFYSNGLLHPDASSGRVYWVQMHGILYVTKLQAIAFYGGMLVGGIFIVLGLMTYFFRRRIWED